MTETIFIVEGTTGEYSDHREWPIVAYRSEEHAKTHVILAEAWERENGVRYSRLGWDRQCEVKSPYDPSYTRDYTGTFYRYYPIEIADNVPQTEVKA